MKKGILFDLDGTLWDSAEGVAASWNQILEKRNRPERATVEWVHSIMGKTMDVIAKEFFPREQPEDAVRMMAECLENENDYLRQHGGILFAGLEETLARLKAQGYFLAIVSNCQEGYIEAFLAHHRLEQYFEDTENFGRTGHGKGYNIGLVVRRNGLTRALYLGDTQGDMDAALEAGIPFLHAAYGFGAVPAGTPAIQDIRELAERAKAFFPA